MDIKEYIKSQTGVYGAWKSAKEISTFKGGGQAFVFYPQSVEKAVELIDVLRAENVDFQCLEAARTRSFATGIADRFRCA